MKIAPQFPPLLKGHRVPQDKSPRARAIKQLNAGEIGAGDLLWSENQNKLNFALVLEPEVPRERCGEMLYMMMVAFGDALGAISAPEVAINYRWPSTILLNEGSIGSADLLVSENETEGIPQWLLLNLEISILPEKDQIDPGLNSEMTTIWDEGCGDISRTQLLESVSRHIVNWIHTWSEEGFKQIHDQWMGRISEKTKLEDAVTDGEFVGMDERGNALVRTAEETSIIETLTALETVRAKSDGSA